MTGAATATAGVAASLAAQGASSHAEAATTAAMVQFSPSKDESGVGDTGPINSALASGALVLLLPGIYYVNAPLVVPQGGILRGPGAPMSLVTDSGYGGGATVMPASGSTQGTVVQVSSGSVVSGLTIDGSNIKGAGACSGITGYGGAYDVYISDVDIYNVPGAGVYADFTTTNPFSWRLEHVTAGSVGAAGFNVPNLTDSTFIDCEAISSGGVGFYLAGCGNVQLHGCRAEESGQWGFYISGSLGGGLSMTGCSTDRNGQSGVYMDVSAGNQPVLISGMMCHRDGKNSTSQGYAGIELGGPACPVVIDGLTVYPGVDDTGGGTASPQFGLNIWGAPTYVGVTSAFLHGIKSGWVNNTTGGIVSYRAVASRTGEIGSPSAVTLVADSA